MLCRFHLLTDQPSDRLFHQIDLSAEHSSTVRQILMKAKRYRRCTGARGDKDVAQESPRIEEQAIEWRQIKAA